MAKKAELWVDCFIPCEGHAGNPPSRACAAWDRRLNEWCAAATDWRGDIYDPMLERLLRKRGA